MLYNSDCSYRWWYESISLTLHSCAKDLAVRILRTNSTKTYRTFRSIEFFGFCLMSTKKSLLRALSLSHFY